MVIAWRSWLQLKQKAERRKNIVVKQAKARHQNAAFLLYLRHLIIKPSLYLVVFAATYAGLTSTPYTSFPGMFEEYNTLENFPPEAPSPNTTTATSNGDSKERLYQGMNDKLIPIYCSILAAVVVGLVAFIIFKR